MSARLAPDDEPEVKGYWEWLLTPNIAAVGRVLYAASWIRRTMLVLGGAWTVVRSNWSAATLVLLLVGPGEIALFVIFAIIVLYAMMPYAIYTYCAQKRIGALANAGLNLVAWYIVEVLLDFAGVLATGYFLD